VTSLFLFDLTDPSIHPIGIDEAGRGPLAGPVFAAAVKLDYHFAEQLSSVNDSKKLTPKKRDELYCLITDNADDYAVAFSSPEEIDSQNIHKATLLAMKRAFEKLTKPCDAIWVDGKFTIPGIAGVSQKAIVKGDGKSACIAAASILAKVSRDRVMEEYHQQYPQYGFLQHKGYGTALHIENLKKYGPSPIHRKTFCGNFVEQAVA
jgi:ribonuclease HII